MCILHNLFSIFLFCCGIYLAFYVLFSLFVEIKKYLCEIKPTKQKLKRVRTKFHKQWYKYYPLTLCVVAAAVFVVYYIYYVDQQLIMMIAYPILIFFCLCEFWRHLSK